MKKMRSGVLSMILIITAAVAIIFLSNSVIAWGIAGYYNERNALTLAPEDSDIVTFQLQNMIGEEDITIVVKIIEGGDYVEIVGPTEYLVPIGTHDTEVKFEITAPSEEGNYPIRLSFETISTGQTGGGVAMETAMERKFSLISSKGTPTTEQPTAEGKINYLPYVIAAIVVIAIILALVLKKSNKKKKK